MASNIRDYVEWYKNYPGLGGDRVYGMSVDNTNNDSNLILRAVYRNNIKPLKPSKLDYENIAEFKIHKLLLEIQDEFIPYNMNYRPVAEWFAKRFKNTQYKINQIRERYWYFKKLDV